MARQLLNDAKICSIKQGLHHDFFISPNQRQNVMPVRLYNRCTCAMSAIKYSTGPIGSTNLTGPMIEPQTTYNNI